MSTGISPHRQAPGGTATRLAEGGQSAERITMIAALRKLNAPGLLERFIRDIVISSYDGSENTALLSSVSVLGAAKAAAVLSTLALEQMPNRPNELIELLLALSEYAKGSFLKIAEAVVTGLDSIGRRRSEPEAFEWNWTPISLRSAPIARGPAPGFKALQIRGSCGVAAEKIASRPKIFSPVTLLVPAIEQICARLRQKTAGADNNVMYLWTNTAEFLLGRGEVPPEPPKDWRLQVKLSCSCPDCSELQSFARDLAARVHRFRVKKERRQHFHTVIERHRLDMTHVTDRVGSPQTLVCTIDRRSFDGRMKQYRQEVAAMDTLLRPAPRSSAATALSKRMQAAIKLATNLKDWR